MGLPSETPDLAWYVGVSAARNTPPRCPFATVERCPKYFHSLSLMGNLGSTRIPSNEEKRLEAFWEKSDLLPTTSEQDPSIFFSDEKWIFFSEFCPEVTFDRFGLFAKGLSNYYDEIDMASAHSELQKSDAPNEHWRWQWEAIKPLHYTECSLFSLLNSQHTPRQKSQDIFSLKLTLWGMSFDLKEAGRRIEKWWKRQRRA